MSVCGSTPSSRDETQRLIKQKLIKLLDVLLDGISVQLFLPGSDIITEGEEGDCMYFLYRGEVEVLVGPSQKQVAILKDGSLFGEMALLGNGKRTATIRTLGVCDCRIISVSAFHTCLKRFPKERKYFDQLAQERLAEINKTKEAAAATPKAPLNAPSADVRVRKLRRRISLQVEKSVKARSAPISRLTKDTDDPEEETSRRSPSAPPTISPLRSRAMSLDGADDHASASRPTWKQPGSGRVLCPQRSSLDDEFHSLDQRFKQALDCYKIPGSRRRILSERRFSNARRSSEYAYARRPSDFASARRSSDFASDVFKEALAEQQWPPHLTYDEAQPSEDKRRSSDVATNGAAVSHCVQHGATSVILSLPILPPSAKLGISSVWIPPLPLSARGIPTAGGC